MPIDWSKRPLQVPRPVKEWGDSPITGTDWGLKTCSRIIDAARCLSVPKHILLHEDEFIPSEPLCSPCYKVRAECVHYYWISPDDRDDYTRCRGCGHPIRKARSILMQCERISEDKLVVEGLLKRVTYEYYHRSDKAYWDRVKVKSP